MLSWIKAFLTNRLQAVRIENALSDTLPVTSGVPQGSCLGPICFLVLINSLPRYVKNGKIFIFADDSKAYLRFKKGTSSQALQENINGIMQWADEFQMCIAVEKCAVMSIGYGNPSAEYKIRDTTLQTVSSMKDLGIQVSNDLKWNVHCAQLAKKGHAKLNCLFRCFKTRRTGFLLQMYKTFIMSPQEYGSPVYSPNQLGDIRLLESVQRHFSRRVPEVCTQNYTERLKSLKLDSLELKRLKTDLIWTFKILHGLVDVPSTEFFAVHQEQRTRSNGLKLKKPDTKKRARETFFSLRVTRPWNALSTETVFAPNVKTFKARLNKESDKLFPFLLNNL